MLSSNVGRTSKLGVLVALAALMALAAVPLRAVGRPAAQHDRDGDERDERRTRDVTPITECPASGILISTPGNYVLVGGGPLSSTPPPTGNSPARTLNCLGSNGIRITASHVNLSLGTTKFTLNAGVPAGTGVGICVCPASGRVSHVRISGPGSVVGFSVGIEIDHADDSEVEHLTVATSVRHGIQTSSVTGLELEGNTLTRNGWFGLNLVDSSEGRIRGNVVSANGIAKGAISNTTERSLTLVLNTAPSQIGVGIGIFGGVGNKVDRNSVTANFGTGIAVDGNSTGNQIRDNESAGNQTFGQGSNGGKFTNLFLGTGSTGNEVGHNVVLSAEDDNLCGVNLFYDNTIITSFISSGVGPNPGTYLAPLSLTPAWVISPATGCIQ